MCCPSHSCAVCRTLVVAAVVTRATRYHRQFVSPLRDTVAQRTRVRDFVATFFAAEEGDDDDDDDAGDARSSDDDGDDDTSSNGRRRRKRRRKHQLPLCVVRSCAAPPN